MRFTIPYIDSEPRSGSSRSEAASSVRPAVRGPVLGGLCMLCLSLVLACSSETKTPAEEAPPSGSAQTAESAEHPGSEAGAGHAPAGFVPGSYDDWCGGHGVPESVCTRCNASLIPAFQATGDWCAEHGLPESQCKACNPDLVIERPPRPEGE